MLKETQINNLSENVFELIGKEWALISAGNEKKYNMMTASWGALGVLWNKNVITVYVRPSRYTLEFMENNDYFSLSFFGNDKSIHKICGKLSGREINKMSLENLTPIFEKNTVYFKEAELVFLCKKIYQSELIKENIYDTDSIEKFYPGENDFHKIFVGEIIKVLRAGDRE